MAQVLSTQNDWPAARVFWKEALRHEPQPAPEMRRGLVEAALHTNERDQAQAQISALLAQPCPSPVDHLLAARLHYTSGDARAALRSARAALSISPDFDAAALFAVECLLGDPAGHLEGEALLWEISKRPTQGGVAALERLSRLTPRDQEQLRTIATALRTHPKAAEGHRLTALSLELRSAPADRAVLLDAAQAYYDTAGSGQLLQFVVWLLRERESARVLTLLSEKRALARKDLFLVRLDAMAEQRQWKGILQLLDRAKVPLENAPRQLYRARCLQELGETGRARIAWRSALDGAGRNPALLQYIASYAERFRAVDAARFAYRQLTESPQSARSAYESLLRLTPREDTAETRDLLGEMARRWPQDLALTNDLAYLNALLAQELPACIHTARQLVRSAPSSLPHRTVLALAELRLGNPEAALQTYEGLAVDWQQAAPGSVVVYAAALRANGREHEARAHASLASVDHLRPEEQALRSGAPMPL